MIIGHVKIIAAHYFQCVQTGKIHFAYALVCSRAITCLSWQSLPKTKQSFCYTVSQKKKKVKRKNWEKKQMENDLEGEYSWRWMLSKTFVLKTFLPNHKKLCQWLHKLVQSKLWIYSNQLQPNFGFMYSFTSLYTYVSIAKEFC